MKYLSTIILLILLLFSDFTSHSQTNRGYKISFIDTVELEQGSHIVSNVINLKNTGKEPIRLGLSIAIPPNWREVIRNDPSALADFSLEAGANKSISLNLMERGKGIIMRESVRIKVWNPNAGDTDHYFFRIKVKERISYELTQETEEFNLLQTEGDRLRFRFTIKNTGNVDDNYTIKSSDKLIPLSEPLQVRLQAGKDTTIEIETSTKSSAWKKIFSEKAQLSVVGTRAAKSRPVSWKVYKTGSEYTQNTKTQKTVPITVGGGLMLNGQRWVYYGQVQGMIQHGNHALNFNYRSKDFGPEAYTFQPNTIYASYRYKGYSIEGGRIQGPQNFQTTGQGARLSYNSKKFGMSVAGMKFSEYNKKSLYRNNNVYGNLYYFVNKVRVEHVVETNFDTYYDINSYIQNNVIHLFRKKTLQLKVLGGAGMNQKMRAINGIEPITLGYSAGYQLDASVKNWLFRSGAKYNSRDYPGIFQGLHIQDHEARRYIKSMYVSAIFRLSAFDRNILIDTLYNSDYLSTNNSKYGLSFGKTFKRGNFNVIAGQMERSNGPEELRRGKFIDASTQLSLGFAGTLHVSSSNAIYNTKTDIHYNTNTSVRLTAKYFNFTGYYNRIPSNYINKQEKKKYIETVNAGPGINFSFFRNSLSGALRYSISKTLSEEKIRHGVGGGINYMSYANGLSIGISGFHPLKDVTNITVPLAETNYGTVYLTKQINVPIKRYKMYNLKITMFDDVNDNGLFDAPDRPLDGAGVSVDKITLVANADGEVYCKNMNRAVYYVGFLNSKYSNLVAKKGAIQIVDLKEDTELLVPFKKGKKLEGNMRIILDSLSSTNMTADNFKIIITDTSGASYNSLTDNSGNFYIYLTEGVYNVALNPEAFKGSDFKPEKISFNVDLTTREDAFVQFTVRQKKRVIRMMNAD